MKINKWMFIATACTILFTSCADEASNLDSATKGSIQISVDETYQPIFEEAVKLYESSNPNTKIKALYKPEADCIEDFINDSTRLIFITRKLSENEKKRGEQKKVFVTRELELARDAIAFITNKSEKDKYTQAEFNEILKGNSPYQIVFDNQSSSTQRYVQDSILKTAPMPKNAFAAKGCADVVQYVIKNPKSIGAIGVTWIADRTDNTASTFLKNVNVIGILPTGDSFNTYRTPMRHYIGLKEYPYLRQLYFISKEMHAGLGTAFAGYMAKMPGQLLLAQANLFPLQVNVNLRQTEIRR